MGYKLKPVVAVLIATLAIATAGPLLAATDSDGDGIPDTAEPLIHTDPQNPDTDGDGVNDLKDKNPVFAKNPISPAGVATPFVISEALVENNYDYVARKDAPDHLELLVANPTGTALADFSIYYTIKNRDTGATEAYFTNLASFTLPAHGEARIHFDDSGLKGHFRTNPNSIYVTSKAAKLFTVALKSKGFKPLNIKIYKDAGGTETAD